VHALGDGGNFVAKLFIALDAGGFQHFRQITSARLAVVILAECA
jgi:hypothetical protein